MLYIQGREFERGALCSAHHSLPPREIVPGRWPAEGYRSDLGQGERGDRCVSETAESPS